MAEYLPSNVLNDRDRPRVLLVATPAAEESTFAWLSARCGTYRRVNALLEVDPSEWDVLVTDQAYTTIRTTDWGLDASLWDRVPDHLFIFRTFRPGNGQAGSRFFEFNIEDGMADSSRALRRVDSVPGHQLRRIQALPEAIQDLVKSTLVPSAEARLRQFGIQVDGEQLAPAVLNFRPFLAGPGDIYLAGSYERPGGAAVWLLPDDAKSLENWFDIALVEWHLKDRRRFPSVQTWQSNPDWDTRKERLAREQLEKLDAEQAEALSRYEAQRSVAATALEAEHAIASSGPKHLLNGQDDELQDAARIALEQLGFKVEDMDLVWDPRERREDFRIRDTDAPGWVAIADVTGVSKGAPGSKLATILGYIMKYLVADKREREREREREPSMWVIVNQLFHRDPLTRGDLYRADDIQTLVTHNGIALDTSALYVLSQSIEPGSTRASECRAWLRSARGQITVADAYTWMGSHP
ncbi:hypothetical protein E3O45_06455 [Cryobacterium sp. TMS1-20-1]|uniref:hypothetical protein n=1 Tax=Cryobacterium sp. TMS1-20-1 TaxID=1259223 RepID=UPI00106BD55E|nr:hypothetical protein [Cryobacterium sp. TMS1-20-1]TFC77891.1 hypothetical protein E3O45_06455 [Cryobacterium sp. TMS1-20-1]